MTETLLDIARRVSGFTHASTKPEYYYRIYEEYLAPYRELRDARVMEIGVYGGESLKVFASYFERGQVIGIDIEDKGLDFSDHPNVRFAQADQADHAKLRRVAGTHAPGGLDIVIDDASHIGWYSKLSFDALFPLVKPGGLYIVEDWGTGYVGDWVDGGPFEGDRTFEPGIPKRLPSHDHGMVGFVKSLVDQVYSECIRPTLASPDGPVGPIGAMHFHQGLVVVRKREM